MRLRGVLDDAEIGRVATPLSSALRVNRAAARQAETTVPVREEGRDKCGTCSGSMRPSRSVDEKNPRDGDHRP